MVKEGVIMYICPVCKRHFDNEEHVAKHSLPCWKEHNPNHKSKSAPRGEDITKREVSDDALDFFASLQERSRKCRK